MKAYQFTIPKVRANPIVPQGLNIIVKDTPEAMGTIQGMTPMSIEEWRIAVGLDKMKLPFKYQVPLKGGYIRGGYLLDFLVFNPFAIPMPVFGAEYWHPSQISENDKLMLIYLQRYYGVLPVIAWGTNLQTQRQADEFLRVSFG
jgi:hypothetical protein